MSLKKALSLLLTLAMLIGIAPLTLTASAAVSTYYVMFGAEGDGRSADTPAGSMAAVVEAVNADGWKTGDTVTVVVIDNEHALDPVNKGAHNMLSWGSTAEHAATLFITSPEGTTSHLCNSAVFNQNNDYPVLSGDVIFDNIMLVMNRRYDSSFCGSGRNVTFTENVKVGQIKSDAGTFDGTFDNYPFILQLMRAANSGIPGEGGTYHININNGKSLDLRAGYRENKTYANDFNVYIENAPGVTLGATQANGYPGAFGKNLNFIFGSSVKSFSVNGTGSNVHAAAVNGSVQVIGSTDLTVNDIAANLTIGGKVYVVKTADPSLLDVTATAGTFAYTGEKIPFAIAANGLSVIFGSEGKIKLNDGESTVVFADDFASLGLADPTAPTGQTFKGWEIEGNKYVAKFDGEIAEVTNYYVMYGGTGDGRSESKPAGTIPDVIRAINADGWKAGDNVTVYVMDAEDAMTYRPAITGRAATESHLTAWSYPDAYTATVTFRGYDGTGSHLTTGATFGYTGGMLLHGPTVFDDITLVMMRMYDASLETCGYDCTINDNVALKQITSDFGSAGIVWDGRLNDYNFFLKTGRQIITGELGKGGALRLNVGNGRAAELRLPGYRENGTYTENAAIYLNAPKGITLSCGSSNSGTNYAKNLSIILGDTAKVTYGKSANNLVIVKGAFQYIHPASVDVGNYTDYITVSKVYDIAVPTAGLLDVTDTAGVYTVSGGKYAYAMSDDGQTIWYGSETLTLPKEGNYTVLTADSLDEIKAIVPVLPASRTFAGWDDDGKGTLTASISYGECYFVSASGSDSNDGSTPETPLATLDAVITKAGGKDFRLCLVGNYEVNAAFPSHAGTMYLSGNDEKSSLILPDGASVTLGGPVEITDLAITGKNSALVFDGYDGAIGKNVTASGVSLVLNKLTSGYGAGAAYSVASGEFDAIAFGSGNYKHNISLIVDAPVGALDLGTGRVAGSFTVVVNNGIKPTVISEPDATKGAYLVFSDKGGRADLVTDTTGNVTAGVVNLSVEAADFKPIVKTADGNTVASAGAYTLAKGTSDIVYRKEGIDTAETNPMTWKPMDKGYITICFDDNNPDLPDFYRIITEDYGFPICAAVPAIKIGTNNTTLHAIENHGGEILSHTYDHTTLNFDRTVATIDFELGEAKRLLEEEGFNVNGIITAGGTGENKTVEFRTFIEQYVAKYYHYGDWYGVSAQYHNPRNYFSGRTTQDVLNIIDKNVQNKTWEVIYAHNFSECSEETLYAVLDHLAELKAEGKVDVVTYRHIFENFGDYRDPVDFGDIKCTVDFYNTDGKTLLGSEATVIGGSVKPPKNVGPIEGYTFVSWSESLDNIPGNMSVRAICENTATGEPVLESDPPVMTHIRSSAYYVCYGGTGDGRSIEEPAPNVAAAIKSINADGCKAGDLVTVYVMEVEDALSYGAGSAYTGVNVESHFTPWTPGGGAPDPYTCTLHVTTYDYENTGKPAHLAASSFFGANTQFAINGPTIFENINTVDTRMGYREFDTNGYYAEFNNVEFQFTRCGFYEGSAYDGKVYSGSANISVGRSYSGVVGTGSEVHFNNAFTGTATYRGVFLANPVNTPAQIFKEDVSVYFNNKDINSNIYFAPTSNTASYAKNLNVIVDNVKNLISTEWATPGTATVFGALQLVFNNGMTMQNDVSPALTVMGGTWRMNSADTEGNKLDVTETAGTFKVIGGMIAVAENESGKTYASENGLLTVPAGTYTVTYRDPATSGLMISVTNGTDTKYYMPKDTVSITSAGTISFPTKYEKEGCYFTGWYSDSKLSTPVLEGSEVADGTTLYAGWEAVDVKNVLDVQGVQIRTSGEQGLRFVTGLSLTLAGEIAQLSAEANKAMDPANSEEEFFNATTGVGYGSLVLPSVIDSSDGLVKDGEYEYNGISYAPAIVPAKNTYHKPLEDDILQYTVCITGITEEKFTRSYTVRPYLTYVDASGIEHTIYGEAYTANLYDTAEYIYKKAEEPATVLETIYNDILSKIDLGTNPLGNTYRALTYGDKTLTVGILGGDEAVNVDDLRTIVGDSFPGSSIVINDAGLLPGAGTVAALYGVSAMSEDDADLVVINAAAYDVLYNSADIHQDAAAIGRQTESLIREIWAKKPYADIVLVTAGADKDIAAVVKTVGETYGVYVAEGNDEEAITKLLTEEYPVSEKAFDHNAVLDRTETLYRSPMDGAAIVSSANVTVSGSAAKTGALAYAPNSITASADGDTASFSFTGSSFGILWKINSNGFNVDYSIDNHGWKNATVKTADLGGKTDGTARLIIFEQELAYGKHNIQFRFNKTSAGTVDVNFAPVYAGSDNGLGKLLAITIDDGPTNDTTTILNVLEKFPGVHVTFFCVGARCNSSTKSILERALSLGCELGNHGYGFDGMTGLTAAQVKDDYDRTQNAIYSTVGVTPKVFRAPGLGASNTMYETIPLAFIGGPIIISDWNADQYTPEERYSAIMQVSGDGNIVLIHNVDPNAKALEYAIPTLLSQGYTLVTVSELYTLRGYNPKGADKVQYTSFAK